MGKLLSRIVGIIIGFTRKIMKAAHFILNTDYVTTQNDDEGQVSVSIPSSFYVAGGAIKDFTNSVTIPGSTSKSFRCYFTSTAFNYAVTGCVEGSIQFGNDEIVIKIARTKDTFTLIVSNLGRPSAHTYNGTSQVITAHIQTFIDPFEV